MQVPPSKYVALQQVDEGQVGGAVVVVGSIVVVSVVGLGVFGSMVMGVSPMMAVVSGVGLVVVGSKVMGVSPMMVVVSVVGNVVLLTGQHRQGPWPGKG